MQPGQDPVPDEVGEEFRARARRQSLLVANSPHAIEDQEFIDSITVRWWEEPDEQTNREF